MLLIPLSIRANWHLCKTLLRTTQLPQALGLVAWPPPTACIGCYLRRPLCRRWRRPPSSLLLGLASSLLLLGVAVWLPPRLLRPPAEREDTEEASEPRLPRPPA